MWTAQTIKDFFLEFYDFYGTLIQENTTWVYNRKNWKIRMIVEKYVENVKMIVDTDS